MTGRFTGVSTTNTHAKERELQRAITQRVESDLPGVEVLAVELSGRDRFTVFVDRAGGVDHALCERVTGVLRDYLREYTVDVSSPGSERPLRKPAHFRNAVGRRVALRTADRRLRGEVVVADERMVKVGAEGAEAEIPYDEIVRANLIDER
jgi:ribosome maturation factor RimP